MPRKFMFTKQEIINAALDLTREKGFDAVTARAMGTKLGTSHLSITKTLSLSPKSREKRVTCAKFADTFTRTKTSPTILFARYASTV